MLNGLARNAYAMLSVINLNRNTLGGEGGHALAQAVAQLRPGPLRLEPIKAHAPLPRLCLASASDEFAMGR